MKINIGTLDRKVFRTALKEEVERQTINQNMVKNQIKKDIRFEGESEVVDEIDRLRKSFDILSLKRSTVLEISEGSYAPGKISKEPDYNLEFEDCGLSVRQRFGQIPKIRILFVDVQQQHRRLNSRIDVFAIQSPSYIIIDDVFDRNRSLTAAAFDQFAVDPFVPVTDNAEQMI